MNVVHPICYSKTLSGLASTNLTIVEMRNTIYLGELHSFPDGFLSNRDILFILNFKTSILVL